MIPETADFTHEDMKRIVADPRYKCGQCKGRLNVAWGGGHGIQSWILRCAKDIEHNTVERLRPSEEDRWSLRLLKGEAKLTENTSTTLMAMTETAMIERVGRAKFVKDLTPVEAKRLALACITYGFDPLMHELTIYQGQPYVEVDGRYRKAQETGLLMGVESRPATKEERGMWEIATEDKFFRASVKKMVAGQVCEFIGWGRVTAQEIQSGNSYTPIVTNPMRMAEKRAEVQALRKGFSIPLPSAEYIGAPGIVEGEYEVVEPVKELAPAVENKVREPARKKTAPEETITPEELPFTEPPAGDIGETEEPKPKTRAKKATTPEVRSDSQPCSEEQQEAIQNALKAAGMAMGDIDKQFNGVREWGVANLRDLTTLRAQIVLDWIATQVGDKEAAEKAAE